VYALGKRPGEITAISMMLAGLIIAVSWRVLNLHDYIFEGMPGILGGLLVYFIATLFKQRYPA
jgi:Na+/pantothenate symporter